MRKISQRILLRFIVALGWLASCHQLGFANNMWVDAGHYKIAIMDNIEVVDNVAQGYLNLDQLSTLFENPNEEWYPNKDYLRLEKTWDYTKAIVTGIMPTTDRALDNEALLQHTVY